MFQLPPVANHDKQSKTYYGTSSGSAAVYGHSSHGA